MVTVILFILILSLLVFVHEFGHFITARKSGMKVHEFGFGFPPRAFGAYKDPKTGKLVWVKGSGKSSLSETVGGEDRVNPDEFPATLYSVNWLPLGGFVKIKGENGEAANDDDSFGAKPFWKKALVLIAGVTMNFVLAAVLLGIGFMSGLPADTSLFEDPQAIVVEPPAIMVQQVEEGSPAEEAGIQFGDTILRINGVAMENSAQMIEYVAAQGEQSLEVVVKREGKEETLTMQPVVLEEGNRPRIGVALGDAGVIRYPWYLALWKGVAAAASGTVLIFFSFFELIKNLIVGKGLAVDVSGPVGIAVVVGESARLGFAYLINVTAMISLSLAVINILPIPALDGGRLVFVVIEKIMGRKVPMKYEQLAHTAGFLLLMLLIIVVTVRDVRGLF